MTVLRLLDVLKAASPNLLDPACSLSSRTRSDSSSLHHQFPPESTAQLMEVWSEDIYMVMFMVMLMVN